MHLLPDAARCAWLCPPQMLLLITLRPCCICLAVVIPTQEQCTVKIRLHFLCWNFVAGCVRWPVAADAVPIAFTPEREPLACNGGPDRVAPLSANRFSFGLPRLALESSWPTFHALLGCTALAMQLQGGISLITAANQIAQHIVTDLSTALQTSLLAQLALQGSQLVFHVLLSALPLQRRLAAAARSAAAAAASCSARRPRRTAKVVSSAATSVAAAATAASGAAAAAAAA